MRSSQLLTVAAALLATPTIVLAEPTSADQPAAAPAATSSAAAAPAAATSAAVTAGLPVKDKNGKPIGKVSQVKTDSSGKTIATIRMGADEFGVNASSLAVDNGTATLNVTKSELNSYLGR
jgi:hypothetical protein